MNRRKHDGPRSFRQEPPPPAPLLTVGSNADVGQVILFFDDPQGPQPKYITFTAEQARGLGYGLIAEADKAEGKAAS